MENGTTDWHYIGEVRTTATQTAFSHAASDTAFSQTASPFLSSTTTTSNISWLHLGGATVVGAIAGVAWSSWRSRSTAASAAAGDSATGTADHGATKAEGAAPVECFKEYSEPTLPSPPLSLPAVHPSLPHARFGFEGSPRHQSEAWEALLLIHPPAPAQPIPEGSLNNQSHGRESLSPPAAPPKHPESDSNNFRTARAVLERLGAPQDPVASVSGGWPKHQSEPWESLLLTPPPAPPPQQPIPEGSPNSQSDGRESVPLLAPPSNQPVASVPGRWPINDEAWESLFLTPPPAPPPQQPVAVVPEGSPKRKPDSWEKCAELLHKLEFLSGDACPGTVLGLGVVTVAAVAWAGTCHWRRITSHLRHALESKSVIFPLNQSGVPCRTPARGNALLQRHGSLAEVVQTGQMALSESSSLSYILPQAFLRMSNVWRRHTNDVVFLQHLSAKNQAPQLPANEASFLDLRLRENKIKQARAAAWSPWCEPPAKAEDPQGSKKNHIHHQGPQNLLKPTPMKHSAEHEVSILPDSTELQSNTTHDQVVRMLKDKLLVSEVEAGRRVALLRRLEEKRLKRVEEKRDAEVASLAQDLQNVEKQLEEARRQLPSAKGDLQKSKPKLRNDHSHELTIGAIVRKTQERRTRKNFGIVETNLEDSKKAERHLLLLVEMSKRVALCENDVEQSRQDLAVSQRRLHEMACDKHDVEERLAQAEMDLEETRKQLQEMRTMAYSRLVEARTAAEKSNFQTEEKLKQMIAEKELTEKEMKKQLALFEDELQSVRSKLAVAERQLENGNRWKLAVAERQLENGNEQLERLPTDELRGADEELKSKLSVAESELLATRYKLAATHGDLAEARLRITGIEAEMRSKVAAAENEAINANNKNVLEVEGSKQHTKVVPEILADDKFVGPWHKRINRPSDH